ncbi:MAG: hypothetical protein ACYTE8_13395 [Planctomycetota bacterium]
MEKAVMTTGEKRSKSFILIIGIILTCLLQYGCSYTDADKVYVGQENKALNWIVEGDYKVVKSLYQMSEEIQRKILPSRISKSESIAFYMNRMDMSEEEAKKLTEEDIIIEERMAEPNEPFNITDVISEPLPSRRFTVGGYSTERAFVVYESGGYAYNQKIIVLSRNENVDVLFFGLNFEETIYTLEELKSLIRKNKVLQIVNEAGWIY